MNPNCDNDKCISPAGEVRLLPYGGGGNLILCRECYENEMQYRRETARETAFKPRMPTWDSLKVYAVSDIDRE